VAIQAFAQAFPNIALAYLYSSSMYFDTRPLMEAMTDVCLHAWHWDAQELTPELLSKAHQQGIRVNAWTVNDIALAQRLLSMGVDGLFTNVPDILLAYLNTPIHLPDKMTTL
jgi:glycerophosphoryl diester phosphodiesterase